ncbi:hypothetical protein C4K88_01085 [Arthrobacter pityocampae]|uniref:Uncharacterized protein n=1 Tax=Arthrobacter pityocampae TaxID=547334 RepID=A0A2S5J150_9MICC|nr:hypothetical protein [Arthrobacter pityocampae]PPB50521.1 hypothetical protein C4K88_01085 [Arthrobacter pityocampae]
MPIEPEIEPDAREIEASREIHRLLALVAAISEKFSKYANVAPGSALAADDARSPHHSVPQYAHSQVTVALGCLESLSAMIVREDADSVSLVAGPFGAYALVRNAMDAAATALWLLEPENGTLRIKRRILLGVDEVRHEYSFHQARGRSWGDNSKKRRARLSEVSKQAGLVGWNPLKAEMPSMTKILKQLERLHDDVTLPWLPAWQLASGHAHGKLWAQLVSHEMTEITGTRTATGASYKVRIRYVMLAALLGEAVQLVETAASRYVQLAST